MRVVEPSHFKKPPEPRRARHYKKFSVVIVISLFGMMLFIFFNQMVQFDDTSQTKSEVTSEKSTVDIPEITSGDGLLPGEMRQFSGNEFKNFYDNLLQPNLDKVHLPPSISGNDIADARIREIAERRGYRLRSSPIVSLPTIDGYQLQETVHEPWRELKQAAERDNIPISIVSAYRSIDNQRQLFLSRLRAEGVDIADVERGFADAAIDIVLITSSVPGYSKHHTGYTMDFYCDGYDFENFKSSSCHDWLIDDNYQVAKQFGFIPSYPVDADLQGPAPEAWEYVWVGSDLLVKQ
jgi:LAS superfamily LD-carboxypeptidase LdcB